MKIGLLIVCLLGSLQMAFAQNEVQKPVVEIVVKTNFFSQEEQAAIKEVLSAYFSGLTTNQFDQWKACYGDTIQKYVSPKRFNNKFERLKGYGFSGDTIRVVWMGKLNEHLGREPGDQFQLVLEFEKELNVVNRVSADHLKVYKEMEEPNRFGITIVQYGSSFRVDMLKYQADGTITWE